MLSRCNRVVASGVLLVVLCGCQDLDWPKDPVIGKPFAPTDMHRYYTPMVENAAAHDMSVADIHFVPHTSALNELGMKRLNMLGIFLAKYGGKVRYETESTDTERNQARVDQIRRYFVEAGYDMTHIAVAPEMSGGRGMTAADALVAKERATSESDTAASAAKSTADFQTGGG